MTSRQPNSLNLDADTALLRGFEHADAELVARFVRAIHEMPKPCRYSCEDVDRRMEARAVMAALRTIGNTPLKSAA